MKCRGHGPTFPNISRAIEHRLDTTTSACVNNIIEVKERKSRLPVHSFKQCVFKDHQFTISRSLSPGTKLSHCYSENVFSQARSC